MSSTTAELTYQQWLNRANLNLLPTIFQKMKLGNMLSPVKVTVASLTATATPDITSAAVLAAATITCLERETGDRLPAILAVKTLRVTAVGTGATGPRIVTDSGGTAVAPSSGIAGVALLSADGTTLTFEGTVTGFVIEYIPRSATALSDNYPRL